MGYIADGSNLILFAVQSLYRDEKSNMAGETQKSRREPVCNISLVHELEALIDSRSAPIIANPKKKTRTYLTDLGEKGHKLTERLKMRVIEGA